MERNTFPLFTTFGQIREARPSDVHEIVNMVRKLAAHHGDTAALTPDDLMRDAFGERPWIYLLVAEAQGALVGYAALYGLIQLQFGARGLDMHHLFAEAEFRGRGVGTGLVEACKMKAQALAGRYLMVGTHPDNREAQAFYEALGFVRRDSHPPRFVLQLAK
jgi:ribosomal protein S18 acetylase RimI-like enzyme